MPSDELNDAQLLRVPEAAALLRCSKGTVYRLLKRHPELAVRIGGLKIRRKRLMELVNGEEPKRPAPPRNCLDAKGRFDVRLA